MIEKLKEQEMDFSEYNELCAKQGELRAILTDTGAKHRAYKEDIERMKGLIKKRTDHFINVPKLDPRLGKM